MVFWLAFMPLLVVLTFIRTFTTILHQSLSSVILHQSMSSAIFLQNFIIRQIISLVLSQIFITKLVILAYIIMYCTLSLIFNREIIMLKI